jgi:general secretion pathway protein C
MAKQNYKIFWACFFIILTLPTIISAAGKPRLLGTVSGGKITQSWAYIEDGESTSGNQSKRYKLQDKLSDGSQIIKISRAEVVLEKNGKQEVLVLEGPRIKEPIVSVSPTHKVVNKNAALARIGSLSNTLRLVEAKSRFNTNGEPGFIVDGIPKSSILERAGFKNGDLIRSVNGQELSTMQKAIQVMCKARNQSQINIELLRSKRLLKLKYDLEN